jgi:hypothetical protein
MSASVISGIGELNGQISNASQNERQNIHSQVEHDGKQKDEACDSQIDPLHILQRTLVVANMIEDGIRSNDRRYDSTDTKNEVSEKLKKERWYLSSSTHPLNACEKLIRISEYFGGPQTVIYGFAAVSREPNPLPMMKIAAQNPPKDLFRMHGHAWRCQYSLGDRNGTVFLAHQPDFRSRRGTSPR